MNLKPRAPTTRRARRAGPKLAGTALAATVLAGTALAACGTTTPPATSTTASSPAPSGNSSGATRTVVDGQGRHVQIPVDVTRIATDLPEVPPMMYLLGGIKDLVSTTSTGVSGFLKVVDPATRDISTKAFASFSGVDVEALATSHPQVVITYWSQAPAVLPSLQQLGIPVVEVGNATQNLDSPALLEASMNLVATVLGGDAIPRAHSWDSYLNSNLATVTVKTSSIPVSQRPTVYYSTSSGPLSTQASTPWITEGGGQDLSAEHGVKNLKSFAFPTIPVESLLRWDPQVIVCEDPASVKVFMTQPQYATLSAVRNHKVYAAPYGIWPWVTGVAEQPLAPLWLAKIISPQLFPNLDLASVVKSFYSQFYDYQLSDTETSAILSATLPQ